MSSPDGKRLRRLEEQVFRSQKTNISKELKEDWVGTEEQNKFADKKISSIVQRLLLFEY